MTTSRRRPSAAPATRLFRAFAATACALAMTTSFVVAADGQADAATTYAVTTDLPSTAPVAPRTVTVTTSPTATAYVVLAKLVNGSWKAVASVASPASGTVQFTYTPTAGSTTMSAEVVWQDGTSRRSASTVTLWGTPGLGANGDPTANIATPSALTACTQYGPADQRCRDAGIDAINLGRAREGLDPLYLPTNFFSMPVDQQLLVLTNGERLARHLRLVSTTNTTLNTRAQLGANANADPSLSGWTVDGRQANAWAGNWAWDAGGPLYSMFLWMYDDGVGSSNGACPAAGGGGCWGHRHNILAWGATDSTTVLWLGAAEATTTIGSTRQLSDATLLVRIAR